MKTWIAKKPSLSKSLAKSKRTHTPREVPRPIIVMVKKMKIQEWAEVTGNNVKHSEVLNAKINRNTLIYNFQILKGKKAKV